MSTHWPSSVLSEVCTGTIENSPSPIPGIWSPWPVNDTIPLLCDSDSSGKLPAWKGQWVFNECTKQNNPVIWTLTVSVAVHSSYKNSHN